MHPCAYSEQHRQALHPVCNNANSKMIVGKKKMFSMKNALLALTENE